VNGPDPGFFDESSEINEAAGYSVETLSLTPNGNSPQRRGLVPQGHTIIARRFNAG
jgi:hypothetical protein